MTTTPQIAPDDVFERVPDDEFEAVWKPPRGLWGRLVTVQNQYIGMRFIVTALFFFVLAGILALLMRLQLIRPENTFLDAETYNRFFTMHGSTMMFLFIVPLVEGMATLILPQMFGARELPYPRLTAFAYWSFLAGGLLFYASFFFDAVPDGGWFAYVPLTTEEYSPGLGMDYWLLGLNVAEIGAIAGATEIILAFFKLRAPGMSLNRIPVFCWAMFVTACMMIGAFTPLIVGSLLLEIDRKFGTMFYNVEGGGSPLLWQHIFWIFGHPDVYVQFLPATGMISTIIPVFARRRLVGYVPVVIALVATGLLSFGLWVHHMFTTGLPELSLSFFSAASLLVAIPSGVQIFAWIATLWRGKVSLKTPMMFALGFFVIFVLGGITGVMLGVAPFDFQAHDSYFVVAHFHYVLFGGSIFPIFAGLYFWSPKYLNVMFDDRLGKIQFWLLFIGFNVTFFPMHFSGILGMPRRVYTYQAGLGLELLNLTSTLGAFLIGASFALFFYNVYISLRRGEKASANPWGADTLEWATPTPTRQYGFRKLPIVRSRHPLWDQEALHEGKEHEETVVESLSLYPTDYRAQLVTSALDARPLEVIRISGPSIWPVVAAVGAMLFSFFLIYDLTLLAGAAGVVVAVAVIAWHRGNRPDHPEDPQKVAAFERITNIEISGSNSPLMNRWTMMIALIILSIIVFTLILVHLYLRLNSTLWPPEGIAVPNALFPGIAAGLMIVGAFTHLYAVLGFNRLSIDGMRLGLIGATLCGVVVIGLLFLHVGQIGFTPQTHAYGSSFFALGVVILALVGVGTLISGVTAFWVGRNDTPPKDYAYLRVIALFWYGITALSLIVFAVLYVVPYIY